jgi:hypothetical protein
MHGTSTSQVEVTHISQHGVWLLANEVEHFLPFDQFPWFKNASIGQIHNVQLQSKEHLYWPDLDVDLSLSIIESPEKFSLVQKPE